MSKNADDLFPNTNGDMPLDAQIEVIQNRQRKGIKLQQWEITVLKAAGKWYEGGTRQCVPILTPEAQAIFDRTYKRPMPAHNPNGYHLAIIPQGTHGEVSKVIEEMHEAMDAHNQGNVVMCLLELSDMMLAMEAVTVKYTGTKLDAHTLHVDPEELAKQKPASWADVCDRFGFVLQNIHLHAQYQISKFSYILETVNRFLWNYNMQLGHLYIMAQATARAFEAGHRTAKNGESRKTA